MAGYPRGRPAVDEVVLDGVSEARCKLHKRVDEQRELRHQAWFERYQAERSAVDRAQGLVRQLAELGVPATAGTSPGTIVLELDAAAELVGRLTPASQ